MATITVTASQNINALTYAAGDAISVVPATMDRVTLTIDAQVPADVVKIEGAKPLSLSTTGQGTIELKNNSTTQPLIVALSALTGGIWTGARTGVIKARGALMNIGTGTGAAGQTIDLDNFPSSNGAVIDVPQVVFVEETPGGALIPCFNIHGARNDANGVAYTGTLFKYLSQFGTTPELGNVFEYDEQSKTIYFGHTDGWHVQVTCTAGTTITIGAQYDHNGSRFVVEGVFTSGSSPKYYTLYLRRISGTNPPISSGSYTKFSGTGETTLTATSAIVATGGWIPPSGCAIKINNIHITAVGVPTADSNRATFDIANANFGAYDLEYTTFSNRFKFGSGNFFGGTYRFRSVAFPFQFVRSGVRDLIDIDGLYVPLDRYVNGIGVGISGCGCEAHIGNVEAWASGVANQTVTVAEMSDLRTLGNLTARTIDRSVGYSYGLTLRAISGDPDSPLITGTLRSIGNSLNLLGLSNVITGSAQYSDNCTALAQQTNAVGFVRFGSADPCVDSVLKNVSVVNGGTVGRSGFYGTGSVSNVNTAIHTVFIDSKGYGGDLFGGTGFGPRTWITDVLAVNHPAASPTIPSGNAYGSTKIRFSGVRSDATHTTQWATIAGATYDRCSAKNNIADATSDDVGMCLQYTNGARTAGAIRFGFNSRKLYENLYTVNSAHTEGVDYAFNGGAALYLKSSGIDITFRNVQPLRGVTSMGGPQTGTATSSSGYGSLTMPTGITAQFRMKPCDSATWGAWYNYTTSADLPNMVTAFNAMTGYAPNIGFDFEWNIVTTTTSASRYLTHLTLDMPVMDSTFTYTEIGFIQVGAYGVEQDAAVSLFNNTTPASPVQYDYAIAPADGSVVFEYPYNFGETPTQIKMVARKPGFDEYIFEGQSWQAGKQVPATLIPAAAITSSTPSTITGVTPNGPAKTLTLTAQLVDAYDFSQWWASQEANMIYAIPLTSSNGGTFTQPSDWTVISTTLNNGKTLAGGTLQLDTAGTYSFALSDLTIDFTATSDAWDLSGSTLSGVITLVNTSGAAITVAMPAGYPTTTIGSGVTQITVTAPVLSQGIDFGAIEAGTTVKVFASGTQTVLATPTGPDWLWSEVYVADRTVDYTIQKAGRDPIRVTGVPLSDSVLPISVQQQVARAYVASSGLTFNTNCFADPDTKLFGLTVGSTLQNFYSRMIESWITEASLQNKPFPIVPNGPSSFTLTNGWDWNLATYANSIKNLSRDGMRLVDSSGVVTQLWAAVLSVGVPAGMQVRYQQQDGLGTTDAENTGNIDQLIQIYKTGTGAFDYTDWLVLKVQAEGYDQAEAVVLDIYPVLDDQLFVVALTPSANGIAAGSADATVTITSEPTPVTWNGQAFSTTITDTTDAHTGLQIMQAIRALNDFNMHDMIRTNGAKFKTVTGNVYGDALTTPAGVRVVKADGTTPHPDFDLFIADNASTYVPPVVAPIGWDGALDGTTVLLYNDVGGGSGVIIDTQVISGAGGYNLDVTLPSGDVAVGDPLRIRFGHKQYYAGELQGTMTSTGWTAVGSMTLHPVYAGWALNGATYDQANGGPFTMDGPNLQVDIDAGTTTGTKKALGAWTQYLMTLPAGLDAFYGAWDLLDLNLIRQNVGVVNVMIDVPTAGALFEFTDNDVNYYRSDFTYPGNIQTGHGLIAITYNAKPFVATVAGSYAITGNLDDVASKVQDAMTAQGFTTTRAPKLDNLDAPISDVPTSSENAAATLAAANITPIASDMKKTNGELIIGDGTTANKFRSHRVP